MINFKDVINLRENEKYIRARSELKYAVKSHINNFRKLKVIKSVTSACWLYYNKILYYSATSAR